mgnify:CR=1 FL=1
MAEAEGFEAMVRAAESNPAIAIQYKMVDQWKEIAGEQVKAFEHMNLGNITVFDGGNGGTSNFLNTLVKTVAPSLGVLDKLPIGETVKGIINPDSKEEKKEEAETAKSRVAELKEVNKTLQTEMDQAAEDMQNLLYTIPNVPYDEVPEGVGAEDNVVEKMGGMETELPKDALPHWELTKKYDLIDFDLGVKITGAGFPVYKGKGAQLQRALINFFLDEARKAGYLEIMPPTVVNAASGYGTGQLPDKEGQMYHCEVDDLYLIPTAEVPVTNIYRDVILEEKQLPIKNCAYTQCFRREAGSYGKDVRGLNRLHEFSKVELVRIDKPEHSRQSHKEMLDHVEGLLQKLELPYRILRLCGGDMSFTAALCFDFEVYSEAQKRWLEVSSVSNFDTYQANRLKCRYRSGEKKTELCHTLNGSALALPRIVAALLENNQTPEGIRIPKALVPYTGFEMID